METTERYWVLQMTWQDDGVTLEHQTTAAVSAEFAHWATEPQGCTYEVLICDCAVCAPPVPDEPDHCECGGILEPSSSYREICRTCGKVYDSIPF